MNSAARTANTFIFAWPMPEVLEEPADLVLNIQLDLDEQSPADKKRFDRVTVEIFDADLLVRSTLQLQGPMR